MSSVIFPSMPSDTSPATPTQVTSTLRYAGFKPLPGQAAGEAVSDPLALPWDDDYVEAAPVIPERHRRVQQVRRQEGAVTSVAPPPRPRLDGPHDPHPYAPWRSSPLRHIAAVLPAQQLTELRGEGPALHAPWTSFASPASDSGASNLFTAATPLRRWPEVAEPLTPMARLLLGDSVYLRGLEHLGLAAQHWCTALEGADRPGVAAALSQRLARAVRRSDGEQALLRFHLATFTPDAATARENYFLAIEHEPGLKRATKQLLEVAKQRAQHGQLFQNLRTTLSALVPSAAMLQRRVVNAVSTDGWREASALGSLMQLAYPHLLMPRCAVFLAHYFEEIAEGEGENFDESAAKFHDLLTFVRALDGNGQLHACGTTDATSYSRIWRASLRIGYRVDPMAFGAICREDKFIQPSIEKRVVADLPWRRALGLPFAGSWQQEVDAHRRGTAQAQ